MNGAGELAPVGRRMSQLQVGQKGEDRDVAAKLSHQRPRVNLSYAENKSGGGATSHSWGGGGGQGLRNASVPLPVILNFIFTSADEISSCSITIHRLAFQILCIKML